MATEKLKFKIELYAEMWNQAPIVEIIINHTGIIQERIHRDKNAPHIIEFEHELQEDTTNKLILKRSNKLKDETVVSQDGHIIKDQILHIKSIEIDEIDIGSLVYEGVYEPKYAEPWFTQIKEAGREPPKTFKNCTGLGHNGTWTFTFGSPFYMWLLENLY